MRTLVLLVVAFAATAAALDLSDRHMFYNRTAFPSEWRLSGFGAPSQKMTFRVLLKQRNLDVFDKLFWDIATPGSPSYRNFLTPDEVMDVIEAPQSERQAVIEFLSLFNITEIQDRRDSLKVTATVAQASELFQTKFYVFQHTDKAARVLRQMGPYSLPRAVLPFVDFVTGVSDFPMIGRRLKTQKASPNVDAYIVPQTMSNMYNVPASASAPSTSQGVAEFQAGEDFDPNDLATFAQQVAVSIPALDNSHIVNQIPPVGIEGTLDIEYIGSTGVGSTNWYWTESDWLYDFGNDLFAATSYPNIISVSYDWSEAAQCDIDTTECQTLGVNSQQYVARVNTEFQKVGAKGISILTASGDSGANGRTDPSCTDPILHPDFPACSPFVTSVGATQLLNEQTSLSNPPPVCQSYQCASNGTEVAVSFDVASFTSGGGFSNYTARPSYQDAAVKAYLTNKSVKLPPSQMWMAANRGFPDISSLGHNVLIYQATEGGWLGVGGTSCASPSVAGWMSLLNEIVIKKSGKPLGFLNPFLYKMWADDPTTFRDITVGDNICTEGGCSATCQGFYAAKGWDPVTGLGVPNVQNMINYVNSHF